MNLLAKKAINRDDFVDILQHTHFADQGAADPDDRYWKVRPLFDVLNTTRIRRWCWCIYTWFLNVSMVQAWRLYSRGGRFTYFFICDKEVGLAKFGTPILNPLMVLDFFFMLVLFSRGNFCKKNGQHA